jgi:hypothetical protein
VTGSPGILLAPVFLRRLALGLNLFRPSAAGKYLRENPGESPSSNICGNGHSRSGKSFVEKTRLSWTRVSEAQICRVCFRVTTDIGIYIEHFILLCGSRDLNSAKKEAGNSSGKSFTAHGKFPNRVNLTSENYARSFL